MIFFAAAPDLRRLLRLSGLEGCVRQFARQAQPRNHKNALHIFTLILVIIGAINWVVSILRNSISLRPPSGGASAALSSIVYIVVGPSELYQLIPLFGTVASECDNSQVSRVR